MVFKSILVGAFPGKNIAEGLFDKKSVGNYKHSSF